MTFKPEVQFTNILTNLIQDVRNNLDNNSSKALPYHNNVHMSAMAKIALTIYSEETHPQSKDINTLIDKTTLEMAALFHDYDHSGGVFTDDQNIKFALIALNNFYISRMDSIERVEPFSTKVFMEIVNNARDAIRCTQFPFIIEPRTLIEKALRDADVLYPAFVGNPEIVMEDLRAELEVRLERSVSYQEMLEGQKAFMNSAGLYTEAGKLLWNLKADLYFTAMENYVAEKSTQQNQEIEMTTKSEYPLSDLGDDFDPTAMPDYDERYDSGEFKGKSTEEIKSIYINEEIIKVQEEDRDDLSNLEEAENNSY